MNNDEESTHTKFWTRISERWQTLIEDGHLSTILWIVFWIAVIGVGGYYFYHSHQEDIIKQQRFTEDDQKAKFIAAENEKYAQIIKSICDQKIQDLTGVELYRCMSSASSMYQYTFGETTIDMKSDLATEPDVPANCKRKVDEFTGNELLDCLK